jgi:exosortase
MPDKGPFLVMLAAWLALFHFLGNSTFGYLKSASLFEWMHYVFTTSPDDSLCLYVPLVVMGLLVWKRRELMAIHPRMWWPAVALVATALILHVAGYAIQQTRVSVFAFAVGLYGLTGLIWGPAWLQGTFFPMFLLVFMVPIGTVADGITLPLRLIATHLAVGFTHGILAIPVHQNGAQILGPDNAPLYEVAPACSGIRSLISLTLLMLIYAWMTFRSTWRRLLLVGSAIPVAIVGNVIRLSVVIIVGEAFGKESGVAIEQKLGFVTFALGLGCMLALGRWLEEPPEPAAAAKESA